MLTIRAHIYTKLSKQLKIECAFYFNHYLLSDKVLNILYKLSLINEYGSFSKFIETSGNSKYRRIHEIDR